MKMRNGNPNQFEHTFQFGVWGLDVSSEGPINKKKGSSYLFNYRYSYSGLADKISGSDEGLDYQDLAFKVNLPTSNMGTFTFWGIGLLDKITQKPEDNVENGKQFRNDKNKRLIFKRRIRHNTYLAFEW